MKTKRQTATSAAAWPADGVALRLLATAALAVSLALVLVAMTGCGEGITAAAPEGLEDEATLREFMEDDGIFDDLGMYEAGVASLDGGGREAIDPLTFWRVVTDFAVTRDVVVDTLLGTADATITRDVWGELHIVTEGMDEIVKPFHHTGLRYASFTRVEDEEESGDGGQSNGESGEGSGEHNGAGSGEHNSAGSGEHNGDGSAEQERHRYRHKNWELTEVSGLLAESDTLTLSIDWIRVQGDSVDVTITDPLALMAVPDEIMLLDVGEEVTVTVSGPPENAVLFLHTRHSHSPLAYDGGTFGGTWTVERPGRRCVWVTALSYETLHDSEYPDDWMAWGVPYEVGGDISGGN